MKRAARIALVPTVVIACAASAAWAGPQDGPVPPPAPAPSGGSILEDGRRAVEIERQQTKVLVDQNLAAARKALENADIETARTFYGKALELDPTNVEAQQGWKNLTADRPSSVSDYFDRARREELIRRDEAAAQVAGYMKKGQSLEAQGDAAGAIKEYSAALAIVSWYTDQTAFGVTSDSLRELIENTRTKAAARGRADRAEQIRRAQAERERDLARERQERMGRMRASFREADLAYRRGEYATAREYARAVLREDPNNASAKELIEITFDAEHCARQQANRTAFDEGWKHAFEAIEEAILPQVNVVEFPDNWCSDIAGRRPRSVGDAAPEGTDDATMAVLATLDAKRVKGLQFVDQNLDQVAMYLRTVTGLNFHVTPKVRTGKFDEVKINIPDLDDVSVRQVLDLVTEPYELRWEVRDGVVTIAMKDEVAGTLRLKYYDVKDLAVRIQNFRGTDIYLAPSNYTPPEPPELPEALPIYPIDALVDTIKTTVQPDSWAVEGASLDLKNGTLIARNTQFVLDEVELLLQEMRRNAGPMINLDVRFITVEDNFLQDVGVDIRGLGDDSQGVGQPGLGPNAPMDDLFFGTPAFPQGAGTGNDSGIFYNDGQDGAYQGRVENLFDFVLGNADTLLGTGGLSLQHTFLDDTAVEVILRAVEKKQRSQQITASELTVFNTQRATVEVLNKVAYIADYDVEIAQLANIANPVVRNAIEGVVLDVKPVVSADRRFITMELRPTVATLLRPIPTFTTSLASNIAAAPVVIQIPRLVKSTVRTTVTMPDGATLLLGGLKYYEQEDATSEVPILGKIPILGFLFSRDATFINRKNLIILITANIVVLEEQEPNCTFQPPALPEPFIPENVLPEEAMDLVGVPCAPRCAPACPPPCPPPAPRCAPPPPAPCAPCRK